jgi:hypothetical protein
MKKNTTAAKLEVSLRKKIIKKIKGGRQRIK